MLHSISWGELSTHFEPHLASVTREVSQTSVLVCYFNRTRGESITHFGPLCALPRSKQWRTCTDQPSPA